MSNMTEDRTTEFGRKLRAHREQARLTIAAAAEAAELSVSRWRQYEDGFAKGSGGIVTALPAPTKIAMVAAAVNWDRDDAYRAAGYDPVDYTDKLIDLEIPDVVKVAWPRLSPKWRSLITRIVIEAAREADVEANEPKRAAPTPLFSSTDEPVVSEPAKRQYTRRRASSSGLPPS